jgi:hydrogenase maturation protease
MGDQVILTVGNVMMGDDAAGPRLAALLQRSPAPGWQVVDGGSAPENVVHRVRAIAPERVLVVDSAEMELGPGEVCLVNDRLIRTGRAGLASSSLDRFVRAALDAIAKKVDAIKKESGADAFAVFPSARGTNEENYIAQKFARAVLGTNNVDHCARL